MPYKKKLIEVALPLEAINKEAAREKSIRHGHPSTLHLWWARRPLAAARAVIWASLVDDPSSLPEQFPTEEAQNAERERLFKILTELVKWENSNNQDVLDRAKAEIMKSTDNNPPPLLDPFAGGGAIPLEAQRLGLEAHASDLNPVAVMINKAMIEIPPKFAGQPPVNPEAKANPVQKQWIGAQGLAEDVRYYGEWMKEKAFEKIGHLYPKVKDKNGREHTVIAWIWARTVKCPNPACGCEMPLVRSFELANIKKRKVFIQPNIVNSNINYTIQDGDCSPDGTIERSGARCLSCNTSVGFDYIRNESKAKRVKSQLLAIIAESDTGRVYLSPDELHARFSDLPLPQEYPSGALHGKAKVNVGLYGLLETSDLFTKRQLNTLTVFCDLVKDVRQEIIINGGSEEYSQALTIYLGFSISKMADSNSSIVSWNINRDGLRNTFSRQAIPMTWDYAEANPFSESAGCFDNSIDWIRRCLINLGCGEQGFAQQFNAQTDIGLRDIMVSTDPPYYDNIAYADLSDFFYIWLRQTLRTYYPDIFSTMLVPKEDELVATPYRFDGNRQLAREYFETGMLSAFQQINLYTRDDIPVTVYYAFKQNDSENDKNTTSHGWEAMLSAIIKAGFVITGTWPMRTERASRTVGKDANALSSSVVLVCRKRPDDAQTTNRRQLTSELREALKSELHVLQSSNISPVDLPQASIGPGMAVYSKYSEVLEADGSSMRVRDALVLINQELYSYLNIRSGRADSNSQFCVAWYELFGLSVGKYGDAENMSKAILANLQELKDDGVLESGNNIVRLKRREELPEKWDSRNESTVWTMVQQLCRCFETRGLDETATHMLALSTLDTSKLENVRNLAYHAYVIAENKGWTDDALAYNSLVTVWPDLTERMAKLKVEKPEQLRMYDIGD